MADRPSSCTFKDAISSEKYCLGPAGSNPGHGSRRGRSISSTKPRAENVKALLLALLADDPSPDRGQYGVVSSDDRVEGPSAPVTNPSLSSISIQPPIIQPEPLSAGASSSASTTQTSSRNKTKRSRQSQSSTQRSKKNRSAARSSDLPIPDTGVQFKVDHSVLSDLDDLFNTIVRDDARDPNMFETIRKFCSMKTGIRPEILEEDVYDLVTNTLLVGLETLFKTHGSDLFADNEELNGIHRPRSSSRFERATGTMGPGFGLTDFMATYTSETILRVAGVGWEIKRSLVLALVDFICLLRGCAHADGIWLFLNEDGNPTFRWPDIEISPEVNMAAVESSLQQILLSMDQHCAGHLLLSSWDYNILFKRETNRKVSISRLISRNPFSDEIIRDFEMEAETRELLAGKKWNTMRVLFSLLLTLNNHSYQGFAHAAPLWVPPAIVGSGGPLDHDFDLTNRPREQGNDGRRPAQSSNAPPQTSSDDQEGNVHSGQSLDSHAATGALIQNMPKTVRHDYSTPTIHDSDAPSLVGTNSSDDGATSTSSLQTPVTSVASSLEITFARDFDRNSEAAALRRLGKRWWTSCYSGGNDSHNQSPQQSSGHVSDGHIGSSQHRPMSADTSSAQLERGSPRSLAKLPAKRPRARFSAPPAVLEFGQHVGSGRLYRAYKCKLWLYSAYGPPTCVSAIAKTVDLTTFPHTAAAKTVYEYTALEASEAVNTELDLYRSCLQRIAQSEHERSAGLRVPQLLGAWQTQHQGVSGLKGQFVVLVMEDVGDARERSSWTAQQRAAILNLYGRLHAHGVIHGDVQERHIRFKEHPSVSSGSTVSTQISIIDFEGGKQLPLNSSRLAIEMAAVNVMVSGSPRPRTNHV